MNETVIQLNETDARKFLLFMKFYDTFTKLVENGVFEQKKAAITLHFDHDSVLRTIQRQDFLYSEKVFHTL